MSWLYMADYQNMDNSSNPDYTEDYPFHLIDYEGEEDFWRVNGTDEGNYTYDMDVACCYPGSERIIVPVIFACTIVLGCLGNVLVIVVVLKNKDHVRNTTNLFILNLAIADTLFLVFCVPFHIIVYITTWPFGEFMCKFVHLLQCSSMVASILTLVAMAVDRYLAVGYPLGTKHLRTPSIALTISLVIWGLSVAFALPWPIYYTVKEYEGIGAVCADSRAPGNIGKATYFLMLFLFTYVVPLVAIFILSILMIQQLWSIQGADGPCRESSLKAKRKVTKLIIVVVVVFCLCWLPNHVVWLWVNYFPLSVPRTYTFYYFKIFAHVLAYGNSSMNPVIYAFLSTQFRKGFHRALHMQCSEVAIQRTPHSSVRFASKVSYSLTPSNGVRPSMSLADTTL